MIRKYQILLWLLMTTFNFQNSHASNITINSIQTVNPFADDGFCTLPEAIQASNTNTASGNLPGECVAGETHPEMDNIYFAVDILPAIFAVETALQVTESVHIAGPHKELVTISGIGLDRVMEINGSLGRQFILSDLTIAGGYAPAGTPPVSVGGGMMISLYESSVHMERLRFENNNATWFCLLKVSKGITP